jgi:hypothetical protein
MHQLLYYMPISLGVRAVRMASVHLSQLRYQIHIIVADAMDTITEQTPNALTAESFHIYVASMD